MYLGQVAPGTDPNATPLQTTDPQGDAPPAGTLPAQLPIAFSPSDLMDLSKPWPYAIAGVLFLLIGLGGGSGSSRERKPRAIQPPTIFHYG